MDYSASKLRLIYFSTFSGNRFHPDHIKIITLELVAAGRFKNQLSQEMPFGTLKEMTRSFPFFQRETTYQRFSLSQPPLPTSVKPKQTARPQRPQLQCSVVPRLALRGGGSGAGSRDVLEQSRTDVSSPGHSSTGWIPAAVSARLPKAVQSLQVCWMSLQERAQASWER